MYPIVPQSVADDVQKGFRQEKTAAKLFVLSELYKTAIQDNDKSFQEKLKEKILKNLDQL